ncbi:MAG TPA: sulfatase-like hydrolase/transferase [Longimicrobiaceae bacterium]
MPSRRGLRLLALLAAPLLHAPLTAQAQEVKRPNILWISTEDLSPRIGAYGDPVARTPNLDRLASEGMIYTNAFTTAPVCAPSRAAIITGMYQNAIGAQHMRTTEDRVEDLPGPYLAVPPFYVKAFPEYLRAAGYYTTNAVKTDYQFGNPFTIWDEVSPQAHWRNRPDPDQPFFAVFNITVTHESQIFADALKGRRPVTDPADVVVPPYYPDTPAIREALAQWYDNIAAMDRRVGEILQQLEEDGLADETIVFFWSDHGDGLPRGKRSLYDSGLRSILMVRWPEALSPPFEPGTVNDELVSFIDLAPTVLSLAGATVPVHMQGRILLGPEAEPAPEYVFAARDRMDIEYDMRRSARDERFLYIRNFQPELPYVGHVPYRNNSPIMQELHRLYRDGKLSGPAALWWQNSRPAEELYDTQIDPHQVHNLASDPAYRETLARMRAAVEDWMERIDDQGLINEAEMIDRMWPGGVQPTTAPPIILERGDPNWQNIERVPRIEFSGSTVVEIYAPTQGSSVGYTLEEGENARWKLYTGPFVINESVTVRAKAIRYGYAESEETRTEFVKRGSG